MVPIAMQYSPYCASQGRAFEVARAGVKASLSAADIFCRRMFAERARMRFFSLAVIRTL